MFRDYESPINTIPAHSLLALRRGEAEKIILLDIKFDEEIVLDYLNLKYLQTANKEIADFLKSTIKDSFNRLMKTSLIGEVRLEKKLKADEDSISVFGENLRQMLLASP